eukprot:570038-Ditylum_brightwellii.AAC.1
MSRDISNTKNYGAYSNQALKIKELEAEYRLLWIRNKQNQREFNKYWIKGWTAGSDKITDTATGSDATPMRFCSFSKGAARAKAAAKDLPEAERASLGKDKNGINIYTRSK